MESIQALRTICQTGKEHDPAWYVVHRRISIYLTWLMLRLGAVPMVASFGMVLCGLTGAVLLAATNGAVNTAGFALCYLAFLLDKVDGELARYQQVQSTHGILIDRFHHRLVEPLVFVAAALHVYRANQAWSALILGLAAVVFANVIEEHQQLAPVLLLKFVKDTGRLPAPHAARPGVAVGVRAAFRVLKGFRLFIVALPGLAAAYAVAAFTTLPAITWYLRLTASALGAYVLFQMVDLWSGGMEAEIELAARRLATAEAPSPARASAAEAARTPARESREAKEYPQCAASPEN